MLMAQNNKISTGITPEMKNGLLTGIAEARTTLAPVLTVNLTPEERHELPKMGDKSIAFVGKAIELATMHPALVPSYLNLPEAKKDFQLTQDLLPIRQELATLLRALEDSMMLAGSEAYEAALIFYNSVKGAARTNVPGAQAVEDELSPRFPRSTRKPATEQQP